MNKAQQESAPSSESVLSEETDVREETERTDAKQEKKTDKKARKRPEIIDRGVLKLADPFTNEGEVVAELEYDFTTLTGDDLIQVLDSRVHREVETGDDNFNARKAKMLFAMAAAGRKKLDARDILKNLSFTDSLAAIQLGKYFFVATLRVGSGNIRSL